MHVILLERIAKLGQMGDEVRVKDGYARNYLLPQGKALRATEANRKLFEDQRAQLEARNLERKQEADAVAERLEGQSVILIRSASERGQLYGSVSTRDIAEALTEGGFTVNRNQVALNAPIKTLGVSTVPIRLHPEVETTIEVNVARSEEEAERQARGEDVTMEADEFELEELDEEDFFEDGEAPEGDEAASGDQGEGDQGEDAEAAADEETTS